MTDPCWRKADLMPATIHAFPVRTEQATPDEAAQAAIFTKAMYDAAIAEGYRRAREEFGIPQPVTAQSCRLSVLRPVS